ncbi:MAG TPA: YraN family protein [Nitrospirota bacterium]|nr:YraN family protein [Nitrospirota bacterium]
MRFLNRIMGREGEDRAARFLEKKGYRILDRNYSAAGGEIDLIALHNDAVVFVEVKMRTSDAFGAPELAVTPQKQSRMVKAALSYIKRKQFHQVPCRFDVVAISPATEKEIELIQNAFEMDRKSY